MNMTDTNGLDYIVLCTRGILNIITDNQDKPIQFRAATYGETL